MDNQNGIELPQMAKKETEAETPVTEQPIESVKEVEQNNTQVQFNDGIDLPDIAMPVEEKHIPTLEELEAQKKAEENAIKQEKKSNHEKTFNRNEEVLYTLKEEQQGNPIVIAVIFGVIAFFVIFLPIINTSLRKFLGIDYKFFQNQWTSTPQVVEQPQQNTKYSFKDPSTRVNIGKLALTNFVTSKTSGKENEYEIDFTIINEGDESYIYDKKYYILLYDGDSLIYRALIQSYVPLASKAATELSLPITHNAYKKSTSFEVVEISETQYPNVEFVNRSGTYDLLTCTNNNDTMEYYFEDNMLVMVKEKYFEEREVSSNYVEDMLEFKANYNKYKNTEGFESTFVETNDDFTMYATANLNQIQDITMTNMKVYKFFKYRTSSNTVAFEMTAKAYTCDNK